MGVSFENVEVGNSYGTERSRCFRYA